MEWIVLPDVIPPVVKTNDFCLINTCGDRQEPCGNNNPCGIKACQERFCLYNY